MPENRPPNQMTSQIIRNTKLRIVPSKIGQFRKIYGFPDFFDEGARLNFRQFENKNIFSGYLKGKTWQNMVPTEAMNKIFKMNKLGNPNYTLIAYTKSDDGVQLSFEADDNLAVALEKLGNNLKAGLSKFKLQRK